MSTDWIKMRVDLRTHPKVVRMASALKADKLRVIGGLFAVWSIFDAHSSDGVLEGYTFESINGELHWRGFAKAMADIEWLIYDPQQCGLLAPRFEEHNGQSAKRRAMETERKRLEREAEKLAADAAKAATKSGQASASDADISVTREEKRREEKDQETSKLSLAPARPVVDQPPQLALVDPAIPKTKGPPDCPHLDVLALWAEVLPSLPQHMPRQWKGTRADHLRARWRETAEEKGWDDKAQGLAYLRKLFAYVGKSAFLTGRTQANGKRPFHVELAWLVNPTNWAKTIEGKYHEDAA